MLEGGEGEVSVGGDEADARRRARRCAARVGLVFQDPDDQLFMPTVEADVAFGPANLGLHGRGAARAGGARRSRRCGLSDAARARAAPALRRRAAPRGGRRRARDAPRRARPRRADVATSTPPRGASWPTCCSRCALTTLLVTHDLPYALELCPRAVVLDHGVVVADGPTREVLADEGFMRAHRLELPAGFNPLAA